MKIKEATTKDARTKARLVTRLLVPIDFSPGSLKAIPYALAISRQFGADVYLLHVVDAKQYVPATSLTLPLTPRAEWNARLMRRLQALVQRYRTGSHIHVLEPREGRAHQEICRSAEALRTDLIVIATHGYTKYQRAFLGSTAERVVQHSPCPVLVVRQLPHHANGGNGQRTSTGFRLSKILASTDFSDSAKRGLSYATKLARDFKAELRLVHVISPGAYPFGDEYAALDAARFVREASQSAVKRMRALAEKSRTRYSLKIEHGSPAIGICEAANQDADLIVISTHGRTGLKHVLIGSVAEHVVRHARCPVLVVPARFRINHKSYPTR